MSESQIPQSEGSSHFECTNESVHTCKFSSGTATCVLFLISRVVLASQSTIIDALHGNNCQHAHHAERIRSSSVQDNAHPRRSEHLVYKARWGCRDRQILWGREKKLSRTAENRLGTPCGQARSIVRVRIACVVLAAWWSGVLPRRASVDTVRATLQQVRSTCSLPPSPPSSPYTLGLRRHWSISAIITFPIRHSPRIPTLARSPVL